MPKLLIVEESSIVRAVFTKLLEQEDDFSYDLAESYVEAESLLAKNGYDYGVVERILSDAQKGEIIALLNKHNLAPLVFTKEVDEEFFESFEGAFIIDYMIKQKYNNVTLVLEKLKQIEANRDITILVSTRKPLFSHYLTQNLSLHGFNVLHANTLDELYEKVEAHPEISLMLLDDKNPYINSLEVVQNLRRFKSSEVLKILSISDETNTYVISTLLNNGVDDYLIEPFSRTELYVRVYQNIKKFC